jgi:FkbM family methyltransferase
MEIYANQKGFTHAAYVGMSQKYRDDNGDQTLRLDYDLDSNSYVMDVGGFEGNWAQDIYCKYKCKVEVYEPIAKYVEIISNKFNHNRDVKVNPYGLGHGNFEDVPMEEIGDATGGFNPSTEESELVQIKDIVEEITSKGRRINLLKLNIEGAEYLLLERMMETGVMDIVDNIQVQFHIFVKDYEYRREQIRKKLSETHEITYDYPFIWENWKIKQ